MEQPILILPSNALKAYNNAKTQEGKDSIALLCGGLDKIQLDWSSVVDLESACRITGSDPKDQRFHIGTPSAQAFAQLEECIKAINGVDFVFDYTNKNQPKWYIVWEYSGSGFRLIYVHYGYSNSGVGSRLSFETQEKAKHAAEYLINLFNQFLK
jgi:hypothetical protein